MRGRIVDEGVQEVSEYIPSKARRNDDNSRHFIKVWTESASEESSLETLAASSIS